MRLLLGDDHWGEGEIDMLRGDVADAQEAQYLAEETAKEALVLADTYQNKYQQIEASIQDKIDSMNGELRKKAMIYLDLIAEYETVLKFYAMHTQVKLATSKITELRKRGGLQV
jgi:hypothetical protein